MNMLSRIPCSDRTIIPVISETGGIVIAILYRRRARLLWSGLVVAEARNFYAISKGTKSNRAKGMRNSVGAKE